MSAVAVFATIATALLAWRARGVPRRVVLGGVAVCVGTVAQAPLGAITVATDLNPIAVMSHFLLAIAMLALSVWVAYQVRRHAGARAPGIDVPDRLRLLGGVAVAAVLGLVTTGAFVTAAGPHPGSSDRPIERLGDFQTAAWVHVRAAVIFSAVFLTVAVWLWRRARGSAVQRLAAAGVVLTLCQIGVGEYQYRNGLPWGVIAVHVMIAATLVVAVVAVASMLADRATGSPGRG